MSRLAPLALVGLVGCGGAQGGVPDGALAVVGDRVFGPADVAAVQAQLGAYAQLRFRGDEGRFTLLQALVDAELMAQAAIDAGLGDDPRVHFAWLEERAAVQRSTELERAVPRAEIEADVAALRAAYDAHPDRFVVPETRVAEGVLFPNWDAAEAALAALELGTETLDSLAAASAQNEGELLRTKPQARDDREFPGLHPVLFAADLQVGERMPVPVVIGERLMVGRLHAIVPAHRRDFDDPVVREQLVELLRAPRLADARRRREAELAERYPETR
jgi:hypothetical protein